MSEVRIVAEPRTAFGKGSARRTRREGKVPAVLYGHGSDPRHISLPARELAHAFKGAAGSNVLLELDLGDGRELALPRQVQRDPLRGEMTHVDLLLVRRGEKVAVDVPVVLSGDAPALKLGGMLDQQITSLHVEADATNIPTSIELDATKLEDIGSAIHAGEIALPDNVTLLVEPDAIVVHVISAVVAEAPAAEAVEEIAAEAPAAAE